MWNLIHLVQGECAFDKASLAWEEVKKIFLSGALGSKKKLVGRPGGPENLRSLDGHYKDVISMEHLW